MLEQTRQTFSSCKGTKLLIASISSFLRFIYKYFPLYGVLHPKFFSSQIDGHSFYFLINFEIGILVGGFFPSRNSNI